MAEKLVWVRSDHLPTYEERKKIVTAALESGLVDIMIRAEDADLRKLGRFDAFTVSGDDISVDGEPIGRYVLIANPEDQERALSLKGKVAHVVVAAMDWKVIPLENLIAAFQGSGTKVLAEARTKEEAKLFLETLEVGVDGIVVRPERPADLRGFLQMTTKTLPDLELTPVKVSRISPLRSGDRVCVDTCSLLNIGEGMLIGSQSSCLFLIHSESLESEYVAARPFRVNAGAVHAYVLAADGKTRYLSEVRSGDELMAVDAEGRCRAVVVGRAKTEVRPLLLLEVIHEGLRFSTILQNAETIRLCTPGGPISVADLQPGQEVLVRLERGGRHFGHAIQETIRER